MERKKYPIRAEDYELFEMVGQGASASVHRALCILFNEIVAIKILDFEGQKSDLTNIMREAQTMILVDHPNVLKAHCSFVNGHNLWVVMPYMAGGSFLHIIKSAYPKGFEEVIIATVLREVLKGLEYLHHHGHIHRDVKAGNILVDARAGVKLGDFGVSACLFDSGDRQRKRNTFVGTPCWMAPEVMEQLNGYDLKADIWSFGITALELAHGHAPFSEYPPMKVFLMTLTNAPPCLHNLRDKKFSRSFKQMIASCLVKDPSKRPTAKKLLKHSFFKQAKSHDYIVRKVLEGLPTLGDQHIALKLKEEDLLAQKKMPDGRKEEISQNEYKRGISGWNFDIEDLKAQASLITDEDAIPCKDQEGCSNSLFGLEPLPERMPQSMPFAAHCSLKDDAYMESNGMTQKEPALFSSPIPTAKYQRYDNEFKFAGSCAHNVLQNALQFLGNEIGNQFSRSCESEVDGKLLDGVPTHPCDEWKLSAGSCISDVLPASERESVKQQNELQNMRNCNGGVISAANADEVDEKSNAPVLQQLGRFKVTSEDVDLVKAPPISRLTKESQFSVTPNAYI